MLSLLEIVYGICDNDSIPGKEERRGEKGIQARAQRTKTKLLAIMIREQHRRAQSSTLSFFSSIERCCHDIYELSSQDDAR